MFTGIIEEVGEVSGIIDTGGFRTISVSGTSVFDDLHIGSSIAVNGVCLTVRTIGADERSECKRDSAQPSNNVFSAEMSRETLDRTSLGSLAQRSIVNLERPMRADARFGGHIVQGHVDGLGRIASFNREGDAWDLSVEYPASAARYIVEKGSIAVDGISLTVASLQGPRRFSVAIIPYTFENTNLRTARAGDPVNLEFDVVAKYVENLLSKTHAIRKD
jgi:riboflavin synthase